MLIDYWNKNFVYFEHDDFLLNKKVLFGDEIVQIKASLDQCKEEDFAEYLGESSNPNYPFRIRTNEGDKPNVRFLYYDPLLTFKVALSNGKKVQVRESNTSPWNDIDDTHVFDENLLYKIVKEESKPKTEHLTKRQLSQWLAQGNGEARFTGFSTTQTSFAYAMGYEDEMVTGNVFVRKWEDTEWHKPTAGYCFGEKGECQEK